MSDPEKIDHLTIVIALAAGEIAKLSARIGRQVQADEPLGELDIMNKLNQIATSLGLSIGVEVS